MLTGSAPCRMNTSNPPTGTVIPVVVSGRAVVLVCCCCCGRSLLLLWSFVVVVPAFDVLFWVVSFRVRRKDEKFPISSYSLSGYFSSHETSRNRPSKRDKPKNRQKPHCTLSHPAQHRDIATPRQQSVVSPRAKILRQHFWCPSAVEPSIGATWDLCLCCFGFLVCLCVSSLPGSSCLACLPYLALPCLPCLPFCLLVVCRHSGKIPRKRQDTHRRTIARHSKPQPQPMKEREVEVKNKKPPFGQDSPDRNSFIRPSTSTFESGKTRATLFSQPPLGASV